VSEVKIKGTAISSAQRHAREHFGEDGCYNSSGQMTAPVCEKGHAVVELAGFAEPTPELCERLPGFFERTLEVSGGRDVKLIHSLCVNRGDPTCRFEGWWT
jgi:hypothetical protein